MGEIHTQSKKYENILSKAGIFAAFLFVAATATYVYSPVFGSNATDNDEKEAQINLNVGPTISLAVDDLFETTATGTYPYIGINGTATTNDKSGFTIIMSDKDTDTNMVNQRYPTKVIESLTSVEANPGTLPENTWGYMRIHTGGGAKVYPIPTVDNPDTILQTTHAGTGGFNIPLYFHISQNLTAGVYMDVLTITAYANSTGYVPTDITSFNPMQDYECSELSAGGTTYLKDTRDNNVYKIGKLADGRCWMLNNLRIVNQTITSADSDVASDFTIPESNLDVEWRNPDIPRAYRSSNFIYGTYYNWHTATAGTGTSATPGGQNAPSSICPKGWRLPTYDEFKVMLASYNGVAASVRAALNLLPSGEIDYYYDSGRILDEDYTGYVWSSTVYEYTWWDSYMGGSGYWSARNLTFAPTTNPSVWSDTTYDTKSYGDAVRCIAR